jgi:hypothetical protein
MEIEAAGWRQVRPQEGVLEMSWIPFIRGQRPDITIGVNPFKRALGICSVCFVAMVLILAGTAGAQAHHGATEGSSPQDPTPAQGTDLVKGPYNEPAALITIDLEAQEGSDDIENYLWIKGSARTARTRLRSLDPPARTTRRPNRSQDVMTIEPRFEPGQLEGPVALDRPGVLERIDSCKAIKGDLEEKGLHGPTEDVVQPETSTILVTEADHSIGHDGLGWEDHRIHRT